MAGLRALLSLVMLAGFYVVAFVQLAATVAFTYWLSLRLPGPLGLMLTLPLYMVGIGSVAGALWVALRSRFEPMGGIVVDRELAGPLWTMVGELAARVGTRAPEEIRIVTGVEASVSERVRLLGLLGGRRYLFLGLPLLLALSESQLRAVVAHELGHYSRAHTRMAPVAYRGRRAIAGTVGRIHKINPAGWVFRAYHRLYLLVDRSVSRLQELQADADAVRAAGRAAAVGSLLEVKALAAAFDHFVDTHIVPRADYGFLPCNLYEGFAAYLGAHEADMARLRLEAVEEKGRVWDTHPPLRERIFLMRRMDTEHEPSQEGRSGAELVGDAAELGRVLTPHVVPHANCVILPWEEFVGAAATAQVRSEARRVLNQKRPLKDAEDREIVMVLADAALVSGVAGWRSSWTGPATLVGADGEPLPLNELARLVRRSKAGRRLAELGIRLGHPRGDESDSNGGNGSNGGVGGVDRSGGSDSNDGVDRTGGSDGMDEKTAARAVQETGATQGTRGMRKTEATHATGAMRGARVLGGVGNVKTEARRLSAEADLLILNTGLVLMPTTRDSDEGNIRLRTALDRMPLEEIAARYRYVPFEEIGSVSVTRRVPFRVSLTLHDGEIVVLRESWTGDRLTEDSVDVLLAMLSRYPGKS